MISGLVLNIINQLNKIKIFSQKLKNQFLMHKLKKKNIIQHYILFQFKILKFI